MTRSLQPRKKDTVSLEELRQRELTQLIEEQRVDLDSEVYADDMESGEEVTLLDPLVAYEQEAARMKSAGPRKSTPRFYD